MTEPVLALASVSRSFGPIEVLHGMVSPAPVSGKFIIGSVLVTPENAASYYFPDSPF